MMPAALPRGLLVMAIVFAAAGCGAAKGIGQGVSKSVSNWMGGEDNAAPPAPLVEFVPTLNVKEGWSTRLGKGTDEQFLKLAPAVLGDRIYTAERHGRVAAYTAATGKVIWEKDTDALISGGPGVGEGLVLLGTSEGEVLALNEADGAPSWRTAVSSEVLAAPRAAHGVVVVHTGDGSITGLGAASGDRLWSYESSTPTLTLRGSSAPLLVDDLAIAGFANGRLVALDLKTGKLVWEAVVALGSGRSDLERMVDIDGEPLLMDDTVYVATYQGRVASVSIASGELLWARNSSSYAGLGVDEQNVYLTDAEGVVWAFDRESGTTIWKQDKLKARAATAPVTIGEHVVIGDVEGYLHWLSRVDGRFATRVRVDETRIIAPPVTENGALYAYSAGGVLAAFYPQ
ncbi:MAG: outer membrane protein assembly factor BamB [Chromatiales bacterium]